MVIFAISKEVLKVCFKRMFDWAIMNFASDVTNLILNEKK